MKVGKKALSQEALKRSGDLNVGGGSTGGRDLRCLKGDTESRIDRLVSGYRSNKEECFLLHPAILLHR